jgi:signal transduction histidine kinase
MRGYRLTADPRDRETVAEARSDFAAAADALWALLPSGPGEQELRQLEDRYAAFDEYTTSELALHEQGWHRTAEYLWHTSGRASYEALVAQINALADWSANATHSNLEARSRSALLVKGLTLGIVVVAAALILLAGIGISTRLSRPIANLAAAAAAIGAGNFTVRVPVDRQDELGLLAQSMNQMAENLQRSRAALEASLAERTQRSRELGVAEERNRLAREIHDTLAQRLTALTLQLEMADALLDDDAARARTGIQRALALGRESLQEARRSVLDLRAAPLEGQSLPDALARLGEEFAREHKVQCQVSSSGIDGRLPARLEAALYRLAQEALTNVAKHARAQHVTLSLTHAGDEFRLVVEDDGVGFDPSLPVPSGPSGGFGLAGMRERVALLGGMLDVYSRPGAGTRLEVRLTERAGQLPLAV